MKIKIAQLNPIIGDLSENTNKIINIINDSKSEDIDFLIFPETAISGYAPLDLLERLGFVDNQLKYLEKIKKSTQNIFGYTGTKGFNVVIGAFSKNEGPGKDLFNSLYVFRQGEQILKYDKICLPTYNIFDEYRHTESGSITQIINGTNVMEWKGKKVAFLICEDALSSEREDKPLYKFDPVYNTFKYARETIDYLFTINASPSNVGKFSLRERIYKKICKKYNVTAVYVNQVGFNSEINYDGQSYVMNSKGEFTYIAEPLKEIIESVDLENDKVVIPNSFNYVKEKLHYGHIISGIRDYFKKQGFEKAVVGCSGGVDSALILALAVDALGKENVLAITMPSEISSEGSVTDSEILCQNLDIGLLNFPIKKVYDTFISEFEEVFGQAKDITKQNSQARIRTGLTLYAFANNFGYLVINTTNKSELTFNYGTIHGDLGGAIMPLSDLWKEEVYTLCKYVNKLHKKEIIPQNILEKIPSAELAPGQFDHLDLGNYDTVEAIGKLFIEQNTLTQDEIRYYQNYLKENSSKEEVEKLVSRIDKGEFKRKTPPIIRVSPKAFIGRIMPIAHKYDNLKYTHPLLDIFEKE